METPGIVYDGKTIRYMTECEQAMCALNTLPKEWVVIVPPAGPASETIQASTDDRKGL